MKKLVLFGAGKIGRSFIGQLFAVAGYEVVFVDISEQIVRELNRRHEYSVVIKSAFSDEIIKVGNVRGILGTETDRVIEELTTCDIAAISVGHQGLPRVIPVLAEGLKIRYKKSGIKPLDIILAENMRNADQYVKVLLGVYLDKVFPFNEMVGLIETSIGKMVPIMPQDVQDSDPLLVYAEPYNTLILDKKAFKNPIPEVKGLAPKENIKAWVDRKSHIHNFGHVAAAYSGFMADPGAVYMADILSIPAVKEYTRSAMLQSADILLRKYPGEFTTNDMIEHINDLLLRFENRALGDTVFRVGCDLKRKLHRNDRILSPLMDGVKAGTEVKKIIQTFICGLSFTAIDENGKMFPGDIEFSKELRANGLSNVLMSTCGLKPETDRMVIDLILSAASIASVENLLY